MFVGVWALKNMFITWTSRLAELASSSTAFGSCACANYTSYTVESPNVHVSMAIDLKQGLC